MIADESHRTAVRRNLNVIDGGIAARTVCGRAGDALRGPALEVIPEKLLSRDEH